jgi:hypothetical protein
LGGGGGVTQTQIGWKSHRSTYGICQKDIRVKNIVVGQDS